MSAFGFLENFYHGLINKVVDEKAIEEYRTNKVNSDEIEELEDSLIINNTNANAQMINQRGLNTIQNINMLTPDSPAKSSSISPTQRFAQKIKESKMAKRSMLMTGSNIPIKDYIPFISTVQQQDLRSNSPSPRKKLYTNADLTPKGRETFSNLSNSFNLNVQEVINDNEHVAINQGSSLNNSLKKKELTIDDKEFILKMEIKAKKEREQLKLSQLGRKKQLSKYSSVVLGDQFSEEEKIKMGITSEYKHSDDNNFGNNENEKKKISSIFLKKSLSKDENSQIIKWRSKSKACPSDIIEKEFKHPEQVLSNTLQKQFEKTKINLPNPDKVENYRGEKFVREKSEIAKLIGNLNNQIKYEKINDKTKLASSIIEDIEKQESWQSYTTLLFADSEMNNNMKTKGNQKTTPTLTTKGNNSKK